MRLSLSRLGMTWGRIGHQRGKVTFIITYHISNCQFRLNILFHRMNKNPYAGVLGDVTYKILYSTLQNTCYYMGTKYFTWIFNLYMGLIGNMIDVLENYPVNLLMKNRLKKKLVMIINRQFIILSNPFSYPFI